MNQLALTLLARKVKAAFGLLPSGFPKEWLELEPLYVDAEGWLVGPGVQHIPIHKSWHYAGLTTKDGLPKAIVWHYTDTPDGTAVNMARRRQQPWSEFAAAYRKSYPGQPVPQTSWSLSIETYGGIVQMAPLTVGTWHAGSDTAKPIKDLGWANRVSNGIELVGYGKAFPGAQVIDAARVTAAIVKWSGMERRFASVTHAELDPKRRSDPGKVWMTKHMDAVLEYAYGMAA